MQILSWLYQLIIGPIQLLFGIIFSVLNKYIHIPGVNIMLLSLVFSLIVLPLYMRADKIQEEAREDEERLGPVIKHIKQYFKGDERFMILQTYYIQNNYSPLGVLRSSVSLLLQVPFFLAAYRMLHDNIYLAGASFGPIKDLGSPDALLNVGAVTINILPFVMTAINLISAAVYANKMPLKSKFQLLAMAAVFLVLLYNSPSGMVLYWTCNNLFSLVKNIINRIVSSKKKAKAEKPAKEGKTLKNAPAYKAVFIFACLTCAVYMGLYLPMMTVAAAPEEFVNLYTYQHPMHDVLDSVAKGFGLFLLWPSIFYAMASKGGRKIMAYVMPMLAVSSILNSKLFSNNFGNMSKHLVYNGDPEFTVTNILISLAVTAAGCIVIFLAVRFGRMATPMIFFSAALVFAILGLTNIGKIDDGYKKSARSTTSKAEMTLSKNGKNVVVIMADRAVGPFIPFLFNEKKELRTQFDGFTYYHNTASYSAHTNSAAPGLLGGYEYTPTEMNKRDNKLMPEKFDEALKVMPLIFTKEGYDATLINPKFAGYQWYPDVSVFDGMENVKAYSTKYSYLPEDLKEGYKQENTECFRLHLFCYSLFKAAPVALQSTLYDDGNYNDVRNVPASRLIDQHRHGNYQAKGHEQPFIWDYYTMKAINSFTNVEDNDKNHFIYFGTDMTHDTQLLSEPSYEPADTVDNTKFAKSPKGQSRFLNKGKMAWVKDSMDFRHYQCDMAALLGIGKWLDYLKEQGVYDNTRIIIVSDHGFHLENFPEMMEQNLGRNLDGESYAPLLMVKDFDSHGSLVTNNDFMTNADTPYLATKGIIDNPVNPYTGNPITDQGKKDGVMIYRSDHWNPKNNMGYTYSEGDWFFVNNDIWKIENWKYLGTR